MKRLCIIPARAGSKRFPGKNIAEIDGSPLVEIASHKAGKLFDLVIVTSDSQEILDSVGDLKDANIQKHLRDPGLATDNCKVLEVVQDLFDDIDSTAFKYHQIWYMLPTCPLVSIKDIRQGVNMLGDKYIAGESFMSVISATKVEFPTQLCFSIENTDIGCSALMGDLHNLCKNNTRSQDFPCEYRPNGAFYGTWWSLFYCNRTFYYPCGGTGVAMMPRERSIDIDTEIDIIAARAISEYLK